MMEINSRNGMQFWHAAASRQLLAEVELGRLVGASTDWSGGFPTRDPSRRNYSLWGMAQRSKSHLVESNAEELSGVHFPVRGGTEA